MGYILPWRKLSCKHPDTHFYLAIRAVKGVRPVHRHCVFHQPRWLPHFFSWLIMVCMMVVQWESVNYSHIFLCPPFSHCCVGRCYWRHPWIVTKRHLHGVANSSAYKRGGSGGGGFLACGVNLGNSASWRGQIFQYGKVLFQWAILGVGRLGEKAWKPEREYFKQTSTVCVPVSPAHQSDNQGHFITKALTNSGSIFFHLRRCSNQ